MNPFPHIKKSIESYLSDEEGSVSRNKILTVGAMMLLMSIIMSVDAFAGHSSHRSHSSHSSHKSHSSHSSHNSHSSHSNAHSSHSSHDNVAVPSMSNAAASTNYSVAPFEIENAALPALQGSALPFANASTLNDVPQLPVFLDTAGPGESAASITPNGK